jgi:hypothetical protein
MINSHFIVCILREEFPDHFKCLSLDNLDLLAMLYLEHKDTILEHYVNDTLKDCLYYRDQL